MADLDWKKLHYENAYEENPERKMEDAFHRLRPINEYLIRAKETMENLQYKLKWKPALERVDPEGADEPSEQPTTHRIHIYSNDPLISENVFGKFHSAMNILDKPGKYNWKNVIRVLDVEPKENVLVVDKIPKTPHVYSNPDTYGLNRQMRALNFLRDSPRKEYVPLIELTVNEYFAKWPRFTKTKISKWEVLTDESRPGTDLQRKFVQIALPTPKTGTPDFAILEGPPGSGKTTAICELVIQAIKRGMRVLLCASTHIAVDNVLERLKNRKEIIAVRLASNMKSVKKSVRDLTLQKRKDTERKSIINYLNKLGRRRDDSQEYLLNALMSEEDDDVITKIILDSANLICGTTIGFLQHPDIQAARDPEPLYDLMILDESSKTTFQEFLVPALYAKRWILSGDVKQLSPYVDEKEVEGNIKGLLDKNRKRDGQICRDVFTAQQGYRRTNNILVVGDSSARYFEKYGVQCRELDLDTITITKENYRSMAPSLELLSAQAILVDREIIGEVGKYLPHDVQIIVPKEELPEILRERRQWWGNKFPKSQIRGREQPWHYHLTWRIIRNYELRKTPEEADRFARDIDKLMPKWYKGNRKDELEQGLHSIARIALPSCLELLQEGFGKTEKEKKWEDEKGRSLDYALSTGFPDKALEPRRVMLKYQHRMHPEISEFPRRHIYLDKETGEPEGLHDPDDMRERRVWNYSRYPKRRWWFDIRDCIFGDNKLCVTCDRKRPDYELNFKKKKPDNVNNHEADKIIQELDEFRKWTKNNPNPENTDWSLTLLTFYRGQEHELSRRLRKYFDSPNFRTFTDKEHHLKVEVCTVDRFQGHESDVVFLSFVRNGFRVGFLNSMHRLNVSLTRARYQLVIFGNRKSFIKAYKKKRHHSELLHALAKETRSDIRWSG